MSPARPRSGTAGPSTGTPSLRRMSATPAQLPASAKAPWTSTTVGVPEVLSVMVRSVRVCGGVGGAGSALDGAAFAGKELGELRPDVSGDRAQESHRELHPVVGQDTGVHGDHPFRAD